LYSIGIFYIAKAFETANHNILLKELATYGIRGTQLDWFKSYLTNHSHCLVFRPNTGFPVFD